MATLKNTTIDDTGYIRLPSGTTAQRPGSPVNGMIRYNTTLGYSEYYNATEASWLQVGTLPAGFVAATGGTITTSGDYKIHTFTSSGTFTVTSQGDVDYLVVGGGGGGGTSRAGGGGAGGYRESVPTPAAWTASPLADSGGSIPVQVTSYPVTVGAGGVGGNGPYQESGSQGGWSQFSSISSAGGGIGRSDQFPNPAPYSIGGPGGSGGGGVNGQVGGTGNTPPVSPPQGNPGGSSIESGPNYGSGGGGGAGVAGTNGTSTVAGPGGNGVTSSINGSPVTRAGGGGGGNYTAPVPQPSGGSGGGGAGGRYSPTAIPGGNGTANTGGGGGGGSTSPADGGGTGGSGIVIIRYKFQ